MNKKWYQINNLSHKYECVKKNILRRIRTPSTLSSREHKRPRLPKGVDFSILVNRYDAVTPFGKEVQEGPPHLPPKPLRDGHPECCQYANASRPTSWRGGAGKMKIVTLPGSTSDRIVSPRPSIFAICDDNVTVETFIHLYNSHLQSRRRGGCITIYRDAASSSVPKWWTHGNTIPPAKKIRKIWNHLMWNTNLNFSFEEKR